MSGLPPKVSVVMSVYNGVRYLQESVESILNQTFTNFELIIIDDGSTDNSWEILCEYAKCDRRIVLIQNQKNIGLTKSLNKGLGQAQGEYIARQDADDISVSNRLELQTLFMDTHPKVGALGTAVQIINEQKITIKEDRFPGEHEQLQAYLLIHNHLHHSTMMVRRSLMQELGGYNETIRHAQDYDLWWRFSCHSRLATLPEILLLRREDNRPRITTTYREEQLKTALKISFKAIQESIGNSSSHFEKAYQQFWWNYLQLLDKKSYQQLWLSRYGKQAELQWQDVLSLEPFWEFLANHPGGIPTWGSRLYNLVYALLEQGQTLAGLQLAWVLWLKFKMPIQWHSLLKKTIKPYILTLKGQRQNLKYKA
ncbi:MAG: glycosyltransferase [Hydrococcus sp. RU_2_2]|jgi:glycosyltransferase involved in cell wall biosynthesis|nr:glycosyltransferase [Hydrococcus sp. RU_2_2]NJP22260.1 glycosyltransferase [Hydrococcus sp. CRU_1_1]